MEARGEVVWWSRCRDKACPFHVNNDSSRNRGHSRGSYKTLANTVGKRLFLPFNATSCTSHARMIGNLSTDALEMPTGCWMKSSTSNRLCFWINLEKRGRRKVETETVLVPMGSTGTSISRLIYSELWEHGAFRMRYGIIWFSTKPSPCRYSPAISACRTDDWQKWQNDNCPRMRPPRSSAKHGRNMSRL